LGGHDLLTEKEAWKFLEDAWAKAESHIRIEGDFCFGLCRSLERLWETGLIGQGTFRQWAEAKEFGFYKMYTGATSGRRTKKVPKQEPSFAKPKVSNAN
jgi:hypothetical protein